MQDYRKLVVWEKSHTFVLELYRLTGDYPKEETYALVQQIRRTASSIPMNIAEGCGRYTDSDLAHFLNMALGSSNEVCYQILLSKDLGYISADKYDEVNKTLHEIQAMLIALINKIRNKKALITHNS
jgi:four helix bundle protein